MRMTRHDGPRGWDGRRERRAGKSGGRGQTEEYTGGDWCEQQSDFGAETRDIRESTHRVTDN
ncbi:hypothetical protein FRUB_02548 [Fimbriiglobus ruber]|uniref:Uncharacterized protein n=1 Tax=Fimbriiglobus ruber TaxID=1908690 RepID=A0A225E0D1_9BACT|nr:hypothetical protein FRUB_02548 [Fimbriiglobus ruber]